MKPSVIRSFMLLLSLAPALLFARQTKLDALLKQAIEGKQAKIGIAVIIDGKDTITVNNDIRYPLMSVVKFHQAMALADYMEKKKLPLNTYLPIKKSDLKPDTYSPLREAFPQGGFEVSIADLLKYTLQQSDNNACDILFKFQGGPAAVNGYIHSLGILGCGIAYTESDMHEDVNLCYDNWSSPLAAAKLLEMCFRKPTFGQVYKDFICRTMRECRTGQDRLVAPLLNKGVTVGHKTGTGDRNANGQQIGCNDIGFISLPDGRTYSIAVFVKDSEESNQANGKIIADISRIVYEYVTQTAE